jgi:hypothetical protein
MRRLSPRAVSSVLTSGTHEQVLGQAPNFRYGRYASWTVGAAVLFGATSWRSAGVTASSPGLEFACYCSTGDLVSSTWSYSVARCDAASHGHVGPVTPALDDRAAIDLLAAASFVHLGNGVWWWCRGSWKSCWGTPRWRHDDHSSKFPSVRNQGLIGPVGVKKHVEGW